MRTGSRETSVIEPVLRAWNEAYHFRRGRKLRADKDNVSVKREDVCPSCRPTNYITALKGTVSNHQNNSLTSFFPHQVRERSAATYHNGPDAAF